MLIPILLLGVSASIARPTDKNGCPRIVDEDGNSCRNVVTVNNNCFIVCKLPTNLSGVKTRKHGGNEIDDEDFGKGMRNFIKHLPEQEYKYAEQGQNDDDYDENEDNDGVVEEDKKDDNEEDEEDKDDNKDYIDDNEEDEYDNEEDKDDNKEHIDDNEEDEYDNEEDKDDNEEHIDDNEEDKYDNEEDKDYNKEHIDDNEGDKDYNEKDKDYNKEHIDDNEGVKDDNKEHIDDNEGVKDVYEEDEYNNENVKTTNNEHKETDSEEVKDPLEHFEERSLSPMSFLKRIYLVLGRYLFDYFSARTSNDLHPPHSTLKKNHRGKKNSLNHEGRSKRMILNIAAADKKYSIGFFDEEEKKDKWQL